MLLNFKQNTITVQSMSPFIILYLGSIGMEHDINEHVI